MRLTLLLSLLLCTGARAQEMPSEIVTSIFNAMRNADTTGLRDHFHPEADIYSVVELPEGNTIVKQGNIKAWFEGISGAAAGAWDERTSYAEVRSDGGLATAWVPYVFYYAGEVHHCGVNAFQFVKDSATERWRVLHITDTRRDAEGDCRELPAEPDAVADIRKLATDWHRAAATTDSTVFFNSIADDGYYLGTDKGEHWTKAEFLGFAAPYFAKGQAWDFTAAERHVFYDPNRQIAWWDEVLDTWMGPCRGTAVVERSGMEGWKIKHYTLSVLVPNDDIQAVIKAIKE